MFRGRGKGVDDCPPPTIMVHGYHSHNAFFQRVEIANMSNERIVTRGPKMLVCVFACERAGQPGHALASPVRGDPQ